MRLRFESCWGWNGLLRLVLALGMAGGLLSCRVPSAGPHRGDKVAPDASVLALEGTDGTLVLRFFRGGRDSYATAQLPDSSGEQLAVLARGPEAKAAWLAASQRKAMPLRVYPPEVWQGIRADLAARLAPQGKGRGILVTAGGRELLAARDPMGIPGFFAPGQFPQGVVISGHRTMEQLLPLALEAMMDSGHTPGNGTPFVLATGSHPGFIWMQKSQRRAVYLAEPCEAHPIDGIGQSSRLAFGAAVSLGVRSGLLAAAKNPCTSAARVAGNAFSFLHVLVSNAADPWPTEPPPPLHHATAPDPAAWEARLDALKMPAPLPAKLSFHIDGSEFFPAFMADVQSARQAIDLQVYIFDNDPYALEIGHLLKRRSESVRVRILMDELASWQAGASHPGVAQAGANDGPPYMAAWLRRESQVQVRPMAMTGLCSSHSKLIIIDGETGWTGGMNVGREYRSEWHDMMIRVEGPLVQAMQQAFGHGWAHAGWGGDAAALWNHLRGRAVRKVAVPAGAVPVRPLPGGPLKAPLFRAQLEAIRHARSRIWIENAYLTDPRITRALVAARYRGVDVRVILPEENDMALMAASNRALIPQLLRCGVRVYVLPGMSHVKAALYDGWACTGSANFDRLSAGVNDEWNIGFSDPATVRALEERLFHKDLAAAREIRTLPTSTPGERMTDSLLQVLAGQF